MQQQLLLKVLCIYSVLVGVVATYLDDFVTLREVSSWSTDELKARPVQALNTEGIIWNRNKLRFQPVQQMPRIFWNKLPDVRPEQGTASAVTTTTSAPATTEPTEEYEKSSNQLTEQTIRRPSKTKAPTTPTTVIMKLPTGSTQSVANVINSSIRPPQIANTIKEMLFHISSFKFNLWQKKPSANQTKAKGFLNVFEVINFENTKCSVAIGDEIDVRMRALEGVCYHEFECTSLGGIPMEPCADGMGVCCVFLTGCGDTTKQAVVYFQSPNYPQPVREILICVLIVNLRENVEQLRLDFIMFELNRPTDGDCVDDQFIVSGQNTNFVVPVLCGINTGQHLYVDVTNSFEKKVYISFISKVATGDRSFNIKIVQLESDLAPGGCLQYFTDNEGAVKSFNYDPEGTFVNVGGATYLNNLNYAICVKRNKDMCSVTYRNEENVGELPTFQIVNKDEEEADLVPDGQAGAGIFNCPDDYIGINQVRLCGERFNDGTVIDDFTQNAPVKDVAAGPIIFPVRTDEEYVGRGFRLIYKQELCAGG
ncbi:uncharacterized protein [Eurosta solidaginis]|uniref:uncharacterized protein n=1 Tax=Eurosta solidaginis TaxID=178769 RepID=UPI003531437D